ncbi:hypothetical protein D3C84_529470 [compost metagenome]
MQVTVRHAAIPDFHRTTLKTQAQQRGTAEHVHRQDALELGIHLAQDFRQAIALGGHAVEDLGQGHRTHCRWQTVAGEIAQQHVHVSGRGERGQQQVAVEQRIGRLQITDIRSGIQAAGVRHLVENGLGHALLVEQIVVVPGDLVTLLQHGVLQAPQAIHRLDLGSENHLVVGLGQKVVTADFQATGQGFAFGQRREEDDRHQGFPGQSLDLPGRLEAVHHRHQRIHQHQVR